MRILAISLFFISISVFAQRTDTLIIEKGYQPKRLFFKKNSTKWSNNERHNDSIIKLAFKESECDKIIAVIYSHSNEIKVDSLLSFKRYKKIVDYVNKKGLVKDGYYIYFLYEPGEDQGISNSAISDLSFVDLLPMKCSIMKDITPK